VSNTIEVLAVTLPCEGSARLLTGILPVPVRPDKGVLMNRQQARGLVGRNWAKCPRSCRPHRCAKSSELGGELSFAARFSDGEDVPNSGRSVNPSKRAMA